MSQGYPRVPAQQGWIDRLVRADFHQRVVESNAAAPFGELVVRQRVGDHAVEVVTAPPAPRNRDDTGSQPVADARRDLDRSAVVVHADALAVADAATGRIGR